MPPHPIKPLFPPPYWKFSAHFAQFSWKFLMFLKLSLKGSFDYFHGKFQYEAGKLQSLDWYWKLPISKLCINVFMRIWKTSWANARVKLHSQVHFGSKKILSWQKGQVPKNFSLKKIGSKQVLGSNFFGLGPKMHLRMEFDSGVGPTCS